MEKVGGMLLKVGFESEMMASKNGKKFKCKQVRRKQF